MLGGFRIQGRDVESAKGIIEDAKSLEEAGAIGVLLENVPSELGKVITEETSFLTFGIGGGPHCDGTLLLSHDLLGSTLGIQPKFAKLYVNLKEQILQGFKEYCKDVREKKYPSGQYGDLKT